MNKTPRTSLLSRHTYDYAFSDTPDTETLSILGTIPNRWSRMPPLSRALVVETGRFLQKTSLLPRGTIDHITRMIGLIGGTARGSLTPDLEFAGTLLQGPNLASPALFGYTLANIPLAEAANHYHLTGPVYAVISTKAPLAAATREARRLIAKQSAYSAILACAFDDYIKCSREERLSVTFKLVQNKA